MSLEKFHVVVDDQQLEVIKAALTAYNDDNAPEASVFEIEVETLFDNLKPDVVNDLTA